MKTWTGWLGIFAISAVMSCGSTFAQASADPNAPPDPSAPALAPPPPSATAGLSSAILEWTPPALAQLSTQALAKENFTFDKTMLAAAAGMMPDTDDDVKQAVAKLDGLSVHMLRFAADGTADPAQVEAIREAYHLRGWKHVVSTSSTGGGVHDNTTDVWVVMDGANLRGAVVLFQSPRSLTLATVAGNLSPVDLLHLRGHFGIPRFEGDLNGQVK